MESLAIEPNLMMIDDMQKLAAAEAIEMQQMWQLMQITLVQYVT